MTSLLDDLREVLELAGDCDGCILNGFAGDHDDLRDLLSGVPALGLDVELHATGGGLTDLVDACDRALNAAGAQFRDARVTTALVSLRRFVRTGLDRLDGVEHAEVLVVNGRTTRIVDDGMSIYDGHRIAAAMEPVLRPIVDQVLADVVPTKRRGR
jgi:hypothetical protein